MSTWEKIILNYDKSYHYVNFKKNIKSRLISFEDQWSKISKLAKRVKITRR